MDQNQNTAGTPVVGATEGKSSMTLIYVLIAGVIIVLLGWYMMQEGTAVPVVDTTAQPVAEQQNTVPTGDNTSAGAEATPDAAAVALSAQGTSDDVAAIDADLSATDLGSLDTSGI
jgi:predicted metalloprotease